MSYKRKSLLFKYGSEILERPLFFVDVGARGNLSQPFADIRKRMPNLLNVVAFEPDEDAALQVKSDLEGGLIINKAAWSHTEKLVMYSTKVQSTSSMFRPNLDAHKFFEPKHMKAREVVRTLEIEGISLDEAMRGMTDLGGSFLKCDTQGSEFEVALGAREYLTEKCVGLTMECWTQPIYKGSRTVDEVIALIKQMNFEIFDIQISALWNRQTDQASLVRKKQVVGIDFLAFKKIEHFYAHNPSNVDILRFVLFADLWGYPDFALQILDHDLCIMDHIVRVDVRNKILKIRKSRNFENKKFLFHRDLMSRQLGLCPRFPLIH